MRLLLWLNFLSACLWPRQLLQVLLSVIVFSFSSSVFAQDVYYAACMGSNTRYGGAGCGPAVASLNASGQSFTLGDCIVRTSTSFRQYYVLSGNTSSCTSSLISTCPDDNTIDPLTGACIPPAADDCSSFLGGDMSGSTTDGSCTCGAGTEQVYIANGETYQCAPVCQAGTVRQVGTTSCIDDCTSGDYSGSTSDGSCDCPVGTIQSVDQCMPDCSEGFHIENGSCQPDPPTCEAPYVAEGGSCVCPTGYQLVTDFEGNETCVNANDGGGDGTGGGCTGDSCTPDTGTGGDTSGGDTGGTGGTSGGDTSGGDTGGSSGGGTGGSSGGGTGGSSGGTGGTSGGTSGGDTSGGDTGGTTGTCPDANGDGFNDETNVSCPATDTGTGGAGGGGTTVDIDLSGVEGLLGELVDGMNADAGSGAQGSFDAGLSGDAAEAQALRAEIATQYGQIRNGISSIFQANAMNGAGSLPCYRNIPLFNGQHFDICLSDYSSELSVIPMFIFGMGFVIAGFVVLGGGNKDA